MSSRRKSFLQKFSLRRKSTTQQPKVNDEKDPAPTIFVECQDDENIWMENLDADSISSEGSSNSAACLKQRHIFHQPLWDKEEVILSLNNLPAGEAALAIIPTLVGETLDVLVEEIKDRKISESENLTLLIPRFANGGIRKASLLAENETALSSTPADLLLKWPNTCLLVSCWLGKLEIVKALLEKGAQVSYRDSDGRTALHLAASYGCSKMTELLLKHGANPGEWDFNRKCTPLHCAAASGDVATVQCLIRAGADINAGLSGKSPLHYAVQNNAGKCVATLLQAGASPNNPQVYTETPLHVAATLGSVECVRLLLRHGADVRVQSGSARSTPLHLAAEEGSPECTRLLLEAGASTDAKNSRGQTALHLATLAQSTETMDILIAAGANVNEEDDNGRTPLHAAVAKAVRGSELVRSLIQAGGSINKPDKFGYTPLHIAALNESSPIVILLLSKGADVTARTKGGISAMSFILRRTPDVLPKFISRLDQAITLHDHELGDVDCELRLDFRPLVPGGRGECDLMLCLVEVGQRHLLKHPLCESFLYLKWLKIRKFFLFSLIFHSIFVAIFTAYIGLTFLTKNVPECKSNFCKNVTENLTVSPENVTDIQRRAFLLTGMTEFENQMSNILFWFVLLFTMILTGKELFQVAHGIGVYAKGWENALQWCVILTSAIVLHKPTVAWQYHVAGVGIVLVWIELMMIVGRFPMFGIYIQMFTQVAVNFFKFLGAYLCLIIGFSLGFSVLHKKYQAFENPFVGLLKTIIMMSGELDFEDVFFDKPETVSNGTSHLLLLAFVILVTFILANLMMGLAVSDIQELRQSAGLERLVRRAELVAHLESLLFSKLLDYAPKKIMRACRSSASLLRLPHHCATHIRPNDPRENRLPRDLIKEIYQLVSERKTKSKINSNASMRSLNGNAFGSNRLSFIESSYSVNKRQQLSDLVTELKKCSMTIGMRLDALTSKVETFAKEADTSTQFSN